MVFAAWMIMNFSTMLIVDGILLIIYVSFICRRRIYRQWKIYKLLMGKRAKPYEPKVYDNAETPPPPDPTDPAQAVPSGAEPPADPATGAESASAADEHKARTPE